jgi:transcription antitermination factor NusG
MTLFVLHIALDAASDTNLSTIAAITDDWLNALTLVDRSVMIFLQRPNRGQTGWGRKGGSLFAEIGLGQPELLGSIAYADQRTARAEALHPWFALRVKSNFERTAALHLRQRGYTEFLPMYESRTRWSDRVKSAERPLFPGYVFCSFDPQRRLPVLSSPGILHVVGIGKEPIPIDDHELEAVKLTLRSGLLVKPWPFLQVGERVVVERGPLAGVEGLVAQFKGAYRLVVSITLLQRSIAAEIDRDWIRPAA